MKRKALLAAVLCLLASGCDDSKNPLSDPQTSKADERLVGVWRERSDDGEVYYHVGHAGEKFPAGMMRVVEITHSKGKVEPPEEYLIFPAVIGDKTYLNVILGGDKKLAKRLDEKGWNSDAVECYTFLKYQFDGDKLVVWLIDEKAKEQAIKSGKVKGVVERDMGKFTDTSENVARFVAGAGDSLWNTKEPGRCERIETGSLAAGEKNEQAVKKAVEAANAWLAVVDQGKYDQSWETAAEYFRNAVGKEQWGKSMKAAREPLGAVKSRKVKCTEYRTKMPGATDGEYVVIQYTTAFENKESAVETVTPMLDKDKAWRVSGYFIK